MQNFVSVIGVLVTTVAIFGLVLMLPVWLLWNWLCPQLFGLPSITLSQGLGLLLLSGFLFRSSSSSK